MLDKAGQPVLDAGCGTGRLLLDDLALGMDLDGVDIYPEMLQFCHEKGQK
jgi:predicted TPR repeat methyltransferase